MNTRCHTPLRFQRAKRTCTLFQGPNLRQIAPGRTGARDPQHRLDKMAIVFGPPARISRLAGQHGFDAFPLLVLQQRSHPPSKCLNSLAEHHIKKCQHSLGGPR